jgi:hypothetical protein
VSMTKDRVGGNCGLHSLRVSSFNSLCTSTTGIVAVPSRKIRVRFQWAG